MIKRILKYYYNLKNHKVTKDEIQLSNQPVKSVYYYVDESGNILNNSKLFIHGCIKTDTPDLLSEILEEVKEEINKHPYFDEFLDKFKKSGFHAFENHFDIRAKFYQKLTNLNWRAYFVIVNKESQYYKTELKPKKEHEIFLISLSKLIFNRIRREKYSRNILAFETIQLSSKSLKYVLRDYFNTLNNKYQIEYKIVKKENEINMAIIDYLNYIIFRILDTNNNDERMKQNFKLFAPKIALIHIMNTKTFLSRNDNKITVDNLIKNW